MPYITDLDLSAKDISNLSSVDAVAGFFTNLGYPTGDRRQLTATSLGLTGDAAQAMQSIELLAADEDDFFRVVFVKVRSITAKVRNDLARKLGQTGSDHLIVLAGNFDVLEFVLLDKRTRQQKGPVGGGTVQIIPRTLSVNRKANTQLDRRILRRLTWTGSDGLDQFEKLRSVFESAVFTSHYFQNRALFADHYLQERLPDDAAWRDNPSEPFAETKQLLRDARHRWTGKAEQIVRDELYEPLWKLLGFKSEVNKRADQSNWEPDYILKGKGGTTRTVAFVYRWDRWLDGPDLNDPDTLEENPGAAVVSALANEHAQWAIVTNGKLWRLYSREAHSRSTNFYEVDLEEALVASDETDPNEAFRYWWLFFRSQAFEPIGEKDEKRCWLDTIVQGSRDYAKRLGERLKDRIFVEIFPHLAQGFLADRKQRLGNRKPPTESELTDTFEATLTLLYRLLFLLYAEARDLLPIGESPYQAASLKRIKDEVAGHAGKVEGQVTDSLKKAYTASKTGIYDRLARLFAVMDKGDSMLNVPCYNGGLFITDPKKGGTGVPPVNEDREHRIARFLAVSKVPDVYLAQAIDRLSRDQDEKTFALVFIDYKSLEVRHLGSIYEGLLEFKLKVAEEDLATKTEKKKEKYIPLTKAKPGRGKKAAAVAVRKGEVYLSNDKAERKATGSYYTPDPIVEYIVEHTVGPVLREKLDALRGDLKKAGRTYHRHMDNARNNPGLLPQGKDARTVAGEETYKAHKGLVDRLFDFKVLDPAMGSGHFLVEAVDFITDTILDFLNRFPHNPVGYALEKTRSSILEALGKQGVTVDSNKLTDVNLLKRHVLKRCIYGVDLNPMAVELAKVSLWLDAFTLGAPLSFLDHHLRFGNSLIGATFKDLEKATEGQLFSIDYQPLLDAIRNVLFINAMADATTAEVHESVRRYSEARKALSGYKIVFDLLVADHFVDQSRDRKGAGKKVRRSTRSSSDAPKPSSLLTHAHDLDLSTRETFLDSLSGDDEREFVANVESLARQADRRFFHWEIEFPEVFFGFADADQRRIKHKNQLAEGLAGFDAVVGNPPYDELSEYAAGRDLPEKAYFANLPLYKDALGGRLNVFRLFVLRAISVLRKGGWHSFIVPMSILADRFTAPLRRRLIRDGFLRSVAAFPQKDDPHNRVFFEAKLSTCIYLVERSYAPKYSISIRTYPGKSFRDAPKSCRVSVCDLEHLEPGNLSLPAIEQHDIDRWQAIASYPRVAKFSDVAPCYLGEIMFNASNRDLISRKEVGPRILRGANVNRHQVLDEAKQGEVVFLKYKDFLRRYAKDVRIRHHKSPRIAFQEASPIDNWRRLIPAYMTADNICGHTLRYFSTDARYDLFAVLACFASELCEWRFGLTSTNNHVNAYEVDVLPIPRFSRLEIEEGRQVGVDWGRWDGILASGVSVWDECVAAEMDSVPATAKMWPDTVHDALAAAGKEMTRLGEERLTLTDGFAAEIVATLRIDEEQFSGMTYIRGGQASFDDMQWEGFESLLRRNRRACGLDPNRVLDKMHETYIQYVTPLRANRQRFAELDAAIDRVVWQLIGLNTDGSLRE